MNVILFDDLHSEHLLPLTFTRPSAGLRVGIKTIAEKWSSVLNQTISHFPYRTYLLGKYQPNWSSDNLLINGRYLPTDFLVEVILKLESGQRLVKDGIVIAAKIDIAIAHIFDIEAITVEVPFDGDVKFIANTHDIFSMNGQEILVDFEAITKGRESELISSTNQLLYKERIFIESGAKIECAILNAKDGPIYIGKNAEVMEGSVVRGPFALCENSVLKLGAKIYGPTTIGPNSKVGGEVNNVVFLQNSNKAHDGFLGNSVIGEWCNIGADTNNSNLKNNYAIVKLWDYPTGRFKNTGLQFCGLIMGDHAKCGINTMFNTGTVVGVGANIFGAGFPRNFIPSFFWGGAQGSEDYRFDKFLETARIVFSRRGLNLEANEELILKHIYDESKKN